MPQGKTVVRVTAAPRRPVARPNYPRPTYSGPPIGRSDGERLADMLDLIRRRCPELTGDDIAFLTRTSARGRRLDGGGQSASIRNVAARLKPSADFGLVEIDIELDAVEGDVPELLAFVLDTLDLDGAIIGSLKDLISLPAARKGGACDPSAPAWPR